MSSTTNRRRQVISQLVTLGLLGAMAIALLAAVPGLRPVVHQIRHLSPAWLLGAVGLELASGVSFVVLFRRFFDRLGGRDARALAWTEQATGALLPGGGAGGLAIGGWLIHLAGAPTDWIVRRSGGLFFLTSAVNSATVIGAALALLLGASGPHDFARAALPALVVGPLTLAVAAVPLVISSRQRGPRFLRRTRFRSPAGSACLTPASRARSPCTTSRRRTPPPRSSSTTRSPCGSRGSAACSPTCACAPGCSRLSAPRGPRRRRAS